MLAISRKSGELLVINDSIFIKVVKVVPGGEEGDKVRLAIEAPDDVKILRGEFLGTKEEVKARMAAVHSRKTKERIQNARKSTLAEESAS